MNETQDWHRRYGDASNERPADLTSDRCELVDALESWGMDELVLEVEADGTDDVAVLLRDSVHGGLVVAYLEDVDGYTRWWCGYRITEGKE